MDNHQPSAIAVVSAAGLFPGADDLDLFWQHMTDRKSAIVPVPPHRWPLPPEDVYAAAGAPDKTRSLKAGLVGNVAFDPSGLHLAPERLARLDPMHHLVLETGRRAWQACRSDPLDPHRVDVILAAIALPTEAASRLTDRIFTRAMESRLFGTGNPTPAATLDLDAVAAAAVTSFPAALLGAALDLGGSTLTLDAACASSLYAVKLACDRLRSGRADAVLAGGVARPDNLYTQIGFTQLQALSPSGRCAPFDRSADGLVVGEGCGIVVLKRLEDALRQGDFIWGVIRGVGLSNDMRGNLLAPDSEGQVRAMRAAYDAAGWTPRDVDLIECHGAGTPVGDAVELGSLRSLWDADGRQTGHCAIGSVKSMIGHLLTAAGVAGLIKVILGMRHGVLPPSLNFQEAAPKSPLHGSPFRVQTEARPWERRNPGLPRRAAVSAFGFGGINAHLLIEEWPPEPCAGAAPPPDSKEIRTNRRREPIAVVGMEAFFGEAQGLEAFQKVVFKGRTSFAPPSAGRWKNCREWVTSQLAKQTPLPGAYLDAFPIDLADFRIPPKEIPDILPQHLLMLKAAAAAMTDAGLSLDDDRPRVGCIVGMGFDLENTNFHLRWTIRRTAEGWNRRHGLDLDADRINHWAAALADFCAPPLTHTRTLGALGGLIASRIAREFRFGGPSFTVSDDAASGLKALAIAADLLRQGEVDGMLVGAVDLPGDLRRIVGDQCRFSHAEGGQPLSLDHDADGSLPGEGAVAVVLKRLSDAERDGNRIYGLLNGIDAARGGRPYQPDDLAAPLARALAAGLAEADAAPETIGYIETHGSGRPAEDRSEFQALQAIFSPANSPPALGTLKACLGHAGAAAGLAGFVKTALCLYHQILPPLPGYRRPPENAVSGPFFHVPRQPVFWPVDRDGHPRRACLNALTAEGGTVVAVLEEASQPLAARIETLPGAPAGPPEHGLFVLQAENRGGLEIQLEALSTHLRQSRTSGIAVGTAAQAWFHRHPTVPGPSSVMAFSLSGYGDFDKARSDARRALREGTPLTMVGQTGCHFTPQPLGPRHRPVLVYPGSGNHYLAMGCRLSVQWPQIWRHANQSTDRFARQCRSALLVPYRSHWLPGWSAETLTAIAGDPVTAICGQVVFGCLVTDLLGFLGIVPSAVIGYSLGETVGYFATGAWPDRGQMLERLEASDLFRTQLAGPYRAVRQTLPIPADETVVWQTAVVNRPADQVRAQLDDFPAVRLLIVNTPDECVVGGHGPAVAALVRRMGCEAVYLEGVVAVHCEAVRPVAQAYRDLHRFPTAPPPGTAYYSCAQGRRIDLTPEAAADSLLSQALDGFDFPAVVDQAYADGYRLFLEVGPQASCTRMIRRILHDRPHIALSVSSDPDNEIAGLARALAVLAAEGQPVSLERYFAAAETAAAVPRRKSSTHAAHLVTISCGGTPLTPPRPVSPPTPGGDAAGRPAPPAAAPAIDRQRRENAMPMDHGTDAGNGHFDQARALIRDMTASLTATGKAHQTFLALTEDLGRQYADAVDLQARLFERACREGLLSEDRPAVPPPASPDAVAPAATSPERPAATAIGTSAVAFDREMCLEFAVGSAARVLGPVFADLDRYPARVRLPDEPLMLVDRILRVEGQKGVLGPGRIVTEHDVRPDAWYLDGGRAPVCIAVEAGQADLFLCAYLGIDLEVKGERTYRLLDAAVTFHRGLPRPGEVIRYTIAIEKFIRQGPTWLFFFHFDGTIDDAPLISMRNGCAGFFTEEEVRRSGGIILTPAERGPAAGTAPRDWQPPVPMAVESYDETKLAALRRGDLAACFGPSFAGISLPANQRLPGGRMALLDRVLELDPAGGRYGLGLIRAEADIQPDAWFLTCHFVDDMVMPGTLMYECCAHALRIFLQRMGWISARENAVYEPVVGREAVLKCRGPVTPETRRVIYKVEIREIGFAPEPFVTADAHMVADGHHIVMFHGMSMKLTGMDRAALEDEWAGRQGDAAPVSTQAPVFDRRRLLAFATGRPSEAFGAPYRPFDEERFIARLPAPPYNFIHRVTRVEPPPWVLAPDGWVHAECDVDPGDWYFRSNGAPFMPICILMEIALQACGFLAAYMGSALKSDKDLHFRNLDGEAVLHGNVRPGAGCLRMRARLLQYSAAGDMLIEHYQFQVDQDGRRVYDGQTSFGFFTADALAQQAGLPGGDRPAALPPAPVRAPVLLDDAPPLAPDDPRSMPNGSHPVPARALRMIDRIDRFDPEGGPAGLGTVSGSKEVDPDEWFFNAHFFQDPVCPGSLGIESLIQLLRFAAAAIWPDRFHSHATALLTAVPHVWRYRGQILPTHGRVEVEAVITERRERPHPMLKADGYLKCDGLYIYKMQGFGLELRPRDMA